MSAEAWVPDIDENLEREELELLDPIELFTCIACTQIPESPPMYYCIFNHHFCARCYSNMQGGDGIPCCFKCSYTGDFQQTQTLSIDTLQRLRDTLQAEVELNDARKQRVAQLQQVQTLLQDFEFTRAKRNAGTSPGRGMRTSETARKRSASTASLGNLFSVPVPDSLIPRLIPAQRHERPAMDPKTGAIVRTASATTATSSGAAQMKCPVTGCCNSRAVASLLMHFKFDHPYVPRSDMVRGQKLSITCNIAVVEPNRQTCLALLLAVKKMGDLELTYNDDKKPIAFMMSCTKSEVDSNKILVHFWFCAKKEVRDVDYFAGTIILDIPDLPTKEVLTSATYPNDEGEFEAPNMCLTLEWAEFQKYIRNDNTVPFTLLF